MNLFISTIRNENMYKKNLNLKKSLSLKKSLTLRKNTN